MSFKDQDWRARFEKLGDEAESIFEAVYPQGWARYGLNRPPINLAAVPAFVRYTPDYITSKGLVEVQGFGRDHTFKLKQDKLHGLLEWQAKMRVDFFVWDSYARAYGWVRLPELYDSITDPRVTFNLFPEGKPYFAWHWTDLPVVDSWVDYGEPLRAAR